MCFRPANEDTVSGCDVRVAGTIQALENIEARGGADTGSVQALGRGSAVTAGAAASVVSASDTKAVRHTGHACQILVSAHIFGGLDDTVVGRVSSTDVEYARQQRRDLDLVLRPALGHTVVDTTLVDHGDGVEAAHGAVVHLATGQPFVLAHATDADLAVRAIATGVATRVNAAFDAVARTFRYTLQVLPGFKAKNLCPAGPQIVAFVADGSTGLRAARVHRYAAAIWDTSVLALCVVVSKIYAGFILTTINRRPGVAIFSTDSIRRS